MTKRKVVPIVSPDEEVRQIPGFQGLYSVSRTGKVWTHAKSMGKSRHGGRWLKPGMSQGYPTVALFKDQKQFLKRVHRLVAMAWISNPENKPHINHINGKRDDARVENLEWCTPGENALHAYATGANRGRRALTDAQVISIRAAVANGMTAKAAALNFGTSQPAMSEIINRKSYAHI